MSTAEEEAEAEAASPEESDDGDRGDFAVAAATSPPLFVPLRRLSSRETSLPPLATLLAHPSTAAATASTDLSTLVLSTAGTPKARASERRWCWMARILGRAAT